MPQPSQLSSSDQRLQQIVRYWNGCLRLVGPLPPVALQARLHACYRHLGYAPPRHRVVVGSPLAGALLASWLHDYETPEASEMVDMIYDLNKLLLQDTREWAHERLRDDARQAIERTVTAPLSEGTGSSLPEFVQRAVWRDALHAQWGRQGDIWQQVAQQANGALAQVLPGLAELDFDVLPPNADAVVEASLLSGLGNLGASELAEIEASAALLGPSAHFWTVLPLRQIARVCSMYWLFDDLAIAAQLPDRLHLDEAGLPHCADGPAMIFPDGWQLWAWHGVRVTQATIEDPAHLTLADVAREPCAQARRVMLERMGLPAERAALSPLRSVAEDGAMRLFQADWAERGWQSEAGAYRMFLQRPAHPDPSRRNYLEPVAEHCNSLATALEWLEETASPSS
ncbi:MAG: hypothetical protein Q7P63_04775 [Verrucomicrobiota bacterium JB022]|nr:hypothetical protein [Verrucomicrobiota bacterium JB022]